VLAEAAGNWQVLGIEDGLRSVVFDSSDSGGDRGQLVQRAIESLAKFNTPTGSDAIGSLGRQELPMELQMRAAAALVSSREAMAVSMLKKSLASGVGDYDLVRNVVNAWGAKQDGLQRLGAGLGEFQADADTAKLLLRAMSAVGENSGSLVERLRKLAGVESDRPLSPQEKLALIAKIDREGDPAAGQWIFRREELQCAKCHAITGAGGNVGPDMSGVGATSPTEYLLDSILAPSQQIKEAYATIRVLTIDGNIVQGVKIDRDETRLVLRDAEGRDSTVPIDDIEEEVEGLSLMPAGLHHLMTERELVDLVAFLGVLGKPGPYAVNSKSTIQRFQYLANPTVNKQLATMAEGEMEGTLDDIADKDWRSAYALVDGRLPTTELSLDDQPVILRGEIDVVVGGTVAINVTPSVGVQVVVNGRSVSPSGSESIAVEPGRIGIYLIYEQSNVPEEVRVEITKPTGSPAAFSISGGS
jgi:putative heme-binding domain-containing protein